MFKNTFNTVYKLGNHNDIKMLVNRSLELDKSSKYDESSDFSEISTEISSDSDMISVPEKNIFPVCCSPVSRYETDLENIMQSSCDKDSTSVNATSSKEKNANKGINQLWNCGSHEIKIKSQESSENKDNPEYCRNLQPYLPKYNKHAQQKDTNEFLALFSKENFNISPVDILQNKFDVTMETNEISSISSTYETDINSTCMTQNFNRFDSKHTQNFPDMFKVDTLKKEQSVNVSEFMKNNSGVITEIIENTPAEKNSKDSFLCMSGKDKKTASSNIFSEDNATFAVKSKGNNRNIKHVCPHCSKCFRFPSKLKKHNCTHNLSETVSEYEKINDLSGAVSMMEKSSNWGSETTTESSKIEIRKAKCVQKCPFCSRIFKVFSKLARHIKTHVGLKPYACQFCSKTFLERFNLLAHVNIHKKEKTYVCDICQRRFNFKSNLTRHLRSHMKKKQFICRECGDAYNSEKMLVIHVRNHEEKRYKCTECVKAFKKKSNLERHSEIHLNERRYACDLCDYAAKRNYHLKRHIERNHTK